jgi:hypothetical protein
MQTADNSSEDFSQSLIHNILLGTLVASGQVVTIQNIPVSIPTFATSSNMQ